MEIVLKREMIYNLIDNMEVMGDFCIFKVESHVIRKKLRFFKAHTSLILNQIKCKFKSQKLFRFLSSYNGFKYSVFLSEFSKKGFINAI